MALILPVLCSLVLQYCASMWIFLLNLEQSKLGFCVSGVCVYSVVVSLWPRWPVHIQCGLGCLFTLVWPWWPVHIKCGLVWPRWPVHIKCGLGGLFTLSVASVACSHSVWPRWPVHIQCGLGGLFTFSVASVACSH